MSLADEFDAIPVKRTYAYSEGPLTPEEGAKYKDAPRIETNGAGNPASLADEFEAIEVPKAGSTADPTVVVDKDKASMPARFAQGMRDPIDAGAQWLVHALPSGVVDSVNNATQYVNDLPVIGPVTKALGMTPATQQQIDGAIRSNEQSYQSSRQAAGNTGVDWMRMLGGVATEIPMTAALPEAKGGMLAKVLMGGGTGALFGGLTPVNDPSKDFAAEKAKQVGLGALFGGATSPVMSGVARVIQPKTNAEVKTLLNAGVTPTPGQILGGIAAKTEDKLTSIPLFGDMIKNSQGRAVIDFNRAAINRALEPIGETLPNGVTGRDAIEYTAGKLGAAYDSVLNKIGAVRPDAQFANDLGSLSSLTKNLPKDSAEQFERVLQNEVLGRIDNGAFTSEGLKAAESNLGGLARGYAKSQDYDKRVLGEAIEEAQAVLRNLVQRTNPEEAKTLQSINQGYANFLRVQRAAGAVTADHGVFSPEQLQGAVKALDSSRNKGAFARGNALMQDLSESGKSVLGAKYPDSGTAGRSLLAAATPLAIAGYSHPMLALGGAAIGGAAVAPYTTLGQKLAAALLTKRPASAEGMANAVRSVSPAIGAAISPALIQALKN